MARLQEQYVNEIAPALNKKFGYKSVMQIPKLDKVIINVAAGEAKENAKVIDAIVADLGQITGQKAIVCKARKSVANFKLREGMPIGAKVTLRGERMYEFVDRLFNVALPRVRDFRGINGNSFDGRGNYAFGLKEHVTDLVNRQLLLIYRSDYFIIIIFYLFSYHVFTPGRHPGSFYHSCVSRNHQILSHLYGILF